MAFSPPHTHNARSGLKSVRNSFCFRHEFIKRRSDIKDDKFERKTLQTQWKSSFEEKVRSQNEIDNHICIKNSWSGLQSVRICVSAGHALAAPARHQSQPSVSVIALSKHAARWRRIQLVLLKSLDSGQTVLTPKEIGRDLWSRLLV